MLYQSGVIGGQPQNVCDAYRTGKLDWTKCPKMSDVGKTTPKRGAACSQSQTPEHWTKRCASAARAAYAGKRRRLVKAKRPVGKKEAARPAPATTPRSMDGEMWEDYRVFKAAGLLAEWRRKWQANLS